MIKSNEVIFKPFHIINISIYGAFLLVLAYLMISGELVENFGYVFGSVFIFLLFLEIRGQLRYSFLLKINNKIVSYKDDKTVIRLEDIESYVGIPGILNTPSKMVFETKKGTEELVLENYNRIKIDKISIVIKEKLGQLGQV